MAIPAGVARIVFTGTLPGGEIWSTGFYITNAPPHSQGQANQLAILMRDSFNSADPSGAMRILFEAANGNPGATWDKVTVYVYEGAAQAAYIGEAPLTPPKTGSQQLRNPDQVALVLTLRTGLPGRRNRGRMYLPVGGLNFGNAGQATLAAIQPIVAGFATAFTDWNASTEGKIVVVSSVGSSFHQVTQVTMDTRADIQRRRANRQGILGSAAADVTQ